MITLSVDEIEQEVAHLTQKGVRKKGELLEIPGHVKLQTMVDLDGNHFQLVQVLSPVK